MSWQFWRRARAPAHPSPHIRDAVVSRFGLEPAEVDGLYCLEQRGTFSGRSVRRVRIYDNALLDGARDAVTRYADLSAQRSAIRFEGHVEKDGAVVLSDRRK